MCHHGETCREVLKAADVQPYIDERSNDVRNGIALRADLHALFDAGLLTIDEAFKVRACSRLISPTYRALDGVQVQVPASENERPSPVALDFRNKVVYQA